jgi:uncharacterized OB-fold protein
MTLPIVPVPRARSYPPRVSAFTQPFWEGLAQGRWQTTSCEDCGRLTFPPKPVCPHCWGERMVWKALPSRGTLYAWTRIHSAPKVFTDEAPYAVGIVDLDLQGGLRIAARLLEDPRKPLACGMGVEVVVLGYEDGPLFAARAV